MSVTAVPLSPRGLALAFNWERVRFVLIFTIVLGSIVGLGWKSSWFAGLIRVMAIGFVAMLVFGLFEQWPKRLPSGLARWLLQVVGVAFVIPWTTFAIYVLSTPDGAPPFWTDTDRMGGYSLLTGLGVFLAPWVALFALVRQKEALARHHALALELAKSEFERQALDARLNLLQAQVAPHFLFNTLANVQALVDSGSPKASEVLQSLIAYLRAAVPRLNEPVTTLGQELQLVRAYLDLMRMRMPDRLQFEVHADESALDLRCPPMTLLTLVENAVRHGIDPGEEGGRIDIHVQRHGERCLVVVSDTGVGLQQSNRSLGTGLTTLRERLELNFGGETKLSVSAQAPKGVRAELEFPARKSDT
jgi:hypothetical protein